MRKFLLGFTIFVCSLSIVSGKSVNNPKKYFYIGADGSRTAVESIKLWKITDFPFLSAITIPAIQSSILAPCPGSPSPAPDHVRWPASAIQSFGTADCGNNITFPSISIEVLENGVTDPPGQGV